MVRWSGVQLVLFGNFASSAMLVFVSVHITPSLIFLKSAENAFLKCVRSISHADARPWPTMPDVGQSRAKSGKVGQSRALVGKSREKSGITMGEDLIIRRYLLSVRDMSGIYMFGYGLPPWEDIKISTANPRRPLPP